MKKIFSGLMALLAVVAFASCNKDKDDPVAPQPVITACTLQFQTEATPMTLMLFKTEVYYFGNQDTTVTNYRQVDSTAWGYKRLTVLNANWTSPESYANMPQVAGYRYTMALDTSNVIVKQAMQQLQDTTVLQDTAVVRQLVKYFGKLLTDSASGIYFDIRMVEHLTYSNGTTQDVAIAEKKVNLRGLSEDNIYWRLLGMLVPSHYAGILPNTSSQRLLLFWLGQE